jgi:lipoic acid synthetase
VTTGNPHKILNAAEPLKVAEAIGDLGLKYLVLTSVCRDDLPDGGAAHFAKAVREIRGRHPDIIVEVLIPDFRGEREAIRALVEAQPQVIGHNIETVERLSPVIRNWRATYQQSLSVLQAVKEIDPSRFTKSSMMLGLGETNEEIRGAMRDLRAVGVDILTLGQYLQPTRTWRHLPLTEFVTPERFENLRRVGEEMGFLYVASGPLVRSSYRAGEFFMEKVLRARYPSIEFPAIGGA